MPAGTVKVFLVGASALRDSEWFGKGDPYAVIECGDKHVRSNTVRDQGSKPIWNQKFHFYVDDSVTEMTVKIYNENTLQVDDLIGSVTFSLDRAFADKKVPIQSYSVQPKGDVNLQLSYTRKVKPAIRMTKSFPGPYSPQTHSSPYV
ncbi:hypothetical protein R1flu_009869 [Riccia fluitans]|uniref:C2 domain-containing protein n=1 Tax=Riccia fluitans TaxID=41844 RepID=A0ABD1Z3D2_9MARC